MASWFQGKDPTWKLGLARLAILTDLLVTILGMTVLMKKLTMMMKRRKIRMASSMMIRMMVTNTVSSHSAVSHHLDPHVYATQLTRTKDQTDPSLLAQPYIFPCATHPGKPKCFTQINIIIQPLLCATVVLHAKWELCACMPTNWDWHWFGPGQYCTLVSSGNNFGIYTKWNGGCGMWMPGEAIS